MKINNTIKLLPIILIGSLILTVLFQSYPAYAEGNSQAVVPTPTAQADGRIIYIVQPGDSWWIISVKTGVPETQLYLLNNTKPDDPLITGQQVLLGIVTPTPPVPTQDVAITPTPGEEIPESSGTGVVCVLLYDDVNGDSVRQLEELPLERGVVSLANNIGTFNVTTETTAGPDPICFNEVPEGEYNLSVAIPDGYNPTSVLNVPLVLMAGDQTTINFGAQLSSLAQPVASGEGGRNPILGIAGLVLLLGGAGLGVYIWLGKRR